MNLEISFENTKFAEFREKISFFDKKRLIFQGCIDIL